MNALGNEPHAYAANEGTTGIKQTNQKRGEDMDDAIVIDTKDNVAVAIAELSAGSTISFLDPQEKRYTFTLHDDIPLYHKFSICAIEDGRPVIKYGQTIGLARGDIVQGAHVHLHNVASLDRRSGKDGLQ